MLDENLGSLGVDPATKDKLLQSVGTAVAGAIGGNAAAGTAGMADAYNRQLHPDERKWAKDNAKAFAEYYERETGKTISDEDAYQRLLSAGYANVDKFASDTGTSDRDAKRFISSNAPSNLFNKDEMWDKPLAGGNANGSLTPEQQARFGTKTPGEFASRAVTKALDYVGQPCKLDCGDKFGAIANAIDSLQKASVLYQDDVGSVEIINKQIAQLVSGITQDEIVRGAASSISETDKAIATLLFGAPSKLLVGSAVSETLSRASMVQQISEIRSRLPSAARKGGNMGFAKIDIDGVPTTMAASSRIDNPSSDQRMLGLVGRVVASEAKILNNIATLLGANVKASGTINLLTERAPCGSCSDVIKMYRFAASLRFPNER
ncbi:hypothetical protein D9X30_3612 [Cupriavidus sp. U2]|nr:hypothetical protein D9X30_3612 [Cupriavidus sp. U2]